MAVMIEVTDGNLGGSPATANRREADGKMHSFGVRRPGGQWTLSFQNVLLLCWILAATNGRRAILFDYALIN
jgi:hypothetical protein